MALYSSSRKKKKSDRYPVPRTPLESLLYEHLDWLRVKHYAENTVTTRHNEIMWFLSWCAERDLAEPTEITRPILERYQRHLFYYRKKNGEPLSYRSQHARLVPLKVWFRWMTRQNYILHNPASELELPRIGHHLPKHVLNEHEIEHVLEQPDIGDVIGLRDRAILETLYSTGMRRMEICVLKLYDVDHDSGTVMIRQGKGRKDRVVPIGERALAWIQKYARESRIKLAGDPDDATVFLTNAGEEISLEHMSDLVRFYIDQAQLGKTGSSHLLRHTMATLMLEGGADIRFIQHILGHASLSTTEIYTHVAIRKLKQVHTATHPAAQLKPKDRAAQAPAKDEAEAAREELLEALNTEADEEDGKG
jgi:integrase/recombinase XerD